MPENRRSQDTAGLPGTPQDTRKRTKMNRIFILKESSPETRYAIRQYVRKKSYISCTKFTKKSTSYIAVAYLCCHFIQQTMYVCIFGNPVFQLKKLVTVYQAYSIQYTIVYGIVCTIQAYCSIYCSILQYTIAYTIVYAIVYYSIQYSILQYISYYGIVLQYSTVGLYRNCENPTVH